MSNRLLFFALFICSGSAFAQTVVTFADLPDANFFANSGGQNIGAHYSGISFGPHVTGLSATRFGGYSSAAFPSHSGDVAIWDAGDPSLTITFSTATQAVAVWYASLDPVLLQAYDKNKNFIGSTTGDPNSDGATGSPTLLSFSSPGIASITVSGTPGTFVLSSLTYGLAASAGGPAISSVAVANGGTDISENSWIVIKGSNLVPANSPAGGVVWSNAPEFAQGKMPTQLNGVSATVNGNSAFVYFFCSAVTSTVCSTDQINVLTPLDTATGPVPVVVTNPSGSSPPFSVDLKPVSPAFLLFVPAGYVAATHGDASLLGPANLYPGYTTPAAPGETIVLYGVGFGPAGNLVNDSAVQSGTLPVNPVCQLGGNTVAIVFAGVISPGLYQFNIVVPASAANGDNPLRCSYGNSTTPLGALITVQK